MTCAYPPAAWARPADRYYYGWYDEPFGGQPTGGETKSMVVDRLRENPQTAPDDVTVDVERNVVILTGEVSSARAKRAAGDDSWGTPGVVDVRNQLAVVGGS